MKIKLDGDRLFSVPEIAIICGVCEATVRKWVKDGKLRLGRSVSNGGFDVRGYTLRDFLQDDPRYDSWDYTIEISDDLKTQYLLAAKDKCVRELAAIEAAMHRERTELNEILDELF